MPYIPTAHSKQNPAKNFAATLYQTGQEFHLNDIVRLSKIGKGTIKRELAFIFASIAKAEGAWFSKVKSHCIIKQ